MTGDVKSKCKHRGFIPSTFGVTLSHIKFSLFTKTAFLINSLTNIIFSIPINIVTLSHKFFIYLFFLIVIRSLIYIVYLILIYVFSFTVAYIISYIRMHLFSFIVAYGFSCTFSLIVICATYYSFIKISNSIPINISFSSSFISFIYISFISFIIFTSFTGLFISDNTIITI